MPKKMLSTLAQAEQALYAYIPNSGTSAMRKNYKLERMHALLDHVGNPQERLNIVHIAGTSGKTSTAYFIRAMLQAAGKHTGLTVSPHINTIAERVQVDGKPLGEHAFVAYLNEFLPLIETSGLTPTYFEVLVTFAYWVFAKEKVDYAVIETGLGGLRDGTNAVKRPDKVCVISDIGLDHTEVLGSTIKEIAAQKAGIIQPGNHVILQPQDSAAMQVVEETAQQQGAAVTAAPEAAFMPPHLPLFQQRNWALALAAYQYVARRDSLPLLTSKQLTHAARQQPPGRLEVWQFGAKRIIIDGAHNPQKLQALCQALAAQGVTSAAVMAGFITSPAEKIEASLAALKPLATHLIVPEFVVVQDIGKRSVSAHELAALAVKAGYRSVQDVSDLTKALDMLLARPEPVLLITGSLYLVSKVMPLLRGKQVHPGHI